MFEAFINAYGLQLAWLVITAVAGYVGLVAKDLATKYINDKTKRAIAKTVVQFVEQVYKDLHGDEKLNAAMAAFSDMLAERGIHVSELEMRVLLEAAVAEFNGVFYEGIALEPAE